MSNQRPKEIYVQLDELIYLRGCVSDLIIKLQALCEKRDIGAVSSDFGTSQNALVLLESIIDKEIDRKTSNLELAELRTKLQNAAELVKQMRGMINGN